MLWVAIGMICTGLAASSCEMVTSQDLFASNEDCEAWVEEAAATDRQHGYHGTYGCTDIDMPVPKPRKGRES